MLGCGEGGKEMGRGVRTEVVVGGGRGWGGEIEIREGAWRGGGIE